MLGLALQGGGAKGAFQIGAVKALYEAGYKFDIVAGVSIGAINAGMIVQGNIDLAYDLWYNLEFSHIMDIEDEYMNKFLQFKIDRPTISYIWSRFKRAVREKGLDRSRTKDLLDKFLDEKKVRDSEMDLGIIICEDSFLNPTPVELYKDDIPEGQLVDYLIASGNLPFFNDLTIGDNEKKYFDGGFYDNLPINLLADKGCDEIIAIRLGDSVAPMRELKNKDVKVTYIDPSAQPGRIMNFNNDSIRRAMKMGYLDTKKLLNNLWGLKYYIVPEDENYFKDLFDSLDSKFYKELLGIFNIKENKKEYSYNIFISHLKSIMKFNDDISDVIVVISLFEFFAKNLSLNRLKQYKVNEFIQDIFILAEQNERFNKKMLRNQDVKIKVFKVVTKYLIKKYTEEAK